MKKNFLNRDFNPDDTHKSKTALRQCHTCLEKLILTWKNTILKFWNLEFLFWSLVTYFRAMKDILVNLSKIKRRLWFVNPGSWHLWTNNRPLGLTQPPTILISIPDSRKKRISNLQTGTFSLNRPQMTTFLPLSLSHSLAYTHPPTHTHIHTGHFNFFMAKLFKRFPGWWQNCCLTWLNLLQRICNVAEAAAAICSELEGGEGQLLEEADTEKSRKDHFA